MEQGSQVHADIIGMGLLEKDQFVGSALVSMYVKCGSLAKAQAVFNKLPFRSVVSWSVLIAGYAQQGHGELALKCFEQMQLEGLSPDAVAFVCALKACAGIGAAEKGKEIHSDISKVGLLVKNVFVGTALVDMYARCGLLTKAQEVFDNLPVRNLITWNALISGYVQHGYGEQAMQCFERMHCENLSADVVTFVCVLKASGIAGAAEKGKEVHAEIVKKSLLERHLVVGTALVDMYAKCSLLAEAQEVFEKLSVQDVVSWSALIAGYAEHGQAEEAMEYFERMQLEGPPANAFTFACILKVCGSIGATDKGREIHADIVREGLLEKCSIVGTALVDMYGKCGLLAEAQEVFDQLPDRDVVSWSVLIAGYALLGKTELVFSSFNKMVEEGTKPNLVTFTSVLNACSHAGLVDEGQKYFDTMRTGYGLVPTLEHHTCMVDLFARAGHLDKAITMLKEMPYCADLTIWLTMLGACHKWGNMKLGRLAFEHVVQINDKEAAAYICMRNIYADAGRQEDADKVEAMRVEKQAW